MGWVEYNKSSQLHRQLASFWAGVSRSSSVSEGRGVGGWGGGRGGVKQEGVGVRVDRSSSPNIFQGLVGSGSFPSA